MTEKPKRNKNMTPDSRIRIINSINYKETSQELYDEVARIFNSTASTVKRVWLAYAKTGQRLPASRTSHNVKFDLSLIMTLYNLATWYYFLS